MSPKDDVIVKINWHELRILTIWATNYAYDNNLSQASKAALYAIVERLEAQHPDKAERQPLTLAGEIKKLREAGFKVSNVVGIDERGHMRLVKGKKEGAVDRGCENS